MAPRSGAILDWMLNVGCWKSFLLAQPGISGIEHSTFNFQCSTFKLKNGRCCDISLARGAAKCAKSFSGIHRQFLVNSMPGSGSLRLRAVMRTRRNETLCRNAPGVRRAQPSRRMPVCGGNHGRVALAPGSRPALARQIPRRSCGNLSRRCGGVGGGEAVISGMVTSGIAGTRTSRAGRSRRGGLRCRRPGRVRPCVDRPRAAV